MIAVVDGHLTVVIVGHALTNLVGIVRYGSTSNIERLDDNKMILRIFSDQPLEEQVYDQVIDILQHSKCPHESLSTTFPSEYYRLLEIGDEIHVYFSRLSAPAYEWVLLHFSTRADGDD